MESVIIGKEVEAKGKVVHLYFPANCEALIIFTLMELSCLSSHEPAYFQVV